MFRYRLFKISVVAIMSVLGYACQMIPHAKQGLPQLSTIQQRQQQYQVELFWKEQTFSFLLQQEQRGQKLYVTAMSMMGQELFSLSYDGKHIELLYQHSMLKHLPITFLMRDIWWSVMPQEQLKSTLEQMDYILQEQGLERKISHQQQLKLYVKYDGSRIEVENKSVPYRMLLSPVQQTLLQ